MSVLELGEKPPLITRRGLLIGGGAAVGLTVAWGLWPRVYPPNLSIAEGEFALNGWVKIGTDGHVTVAIPQIELGQGVYTVLAQIVADELGADWRTVSVEPAPINPLYANHLFAEEAGWKSHWPHAEADGSLQITGGSTSLRGFGLECRKAGAAARALLCMAAGKRWDADWLACETANGFVTRGADRLRFGAVAAEAASLTPPEDIPFRGGVENRLIGQSLPRLDLPSKVDGSANYAADVRLPGMVFASIRHGPAGDSRLDSINEKAGRKIAGLVDVVRQDRWVAAVANTWWAANKAVDALRPRFKTSTPKAGDSSIARALDKAFSDSGTRISEAGDVASSFKGQTVYTAEYSIGLAAHAAIEPMSATAWLDKGQLQLWIATQAPGPARLAAAKAIGLSPADVVVHASFVGGSFGRKYETEIAAEAAILADQLKRPVQLCWSRPEDMMQDRFRPAAKARMAARIARAQVDGWQARIAAPATMAEFGARVLGGKDATEALSDHGGTVDALAVEGGIPPYNIPNVSLDHYPANIGLPTGQWRGGAHGLTAFFTESFVDELATIAGVEPFSFRMGMLGQNPRLAYCLSRAAALGGWQGGGQGTEQGLACHSMRGSHIALLAEARLDDSQRVRVTRLVAVADVGTMAHSGIVRQQIEGGLIFGMSAATGNSVRINRGVARPMRLGNLGLPRLADCPEIIVELVRSKQTSGGAGDLGAPVVAPAIANALHAGSGRRFRSLPLSPMVLA